MFESETIPEDLLQSRKILSELKKIFVDLLGFSLSEIDIHAHFLEMGVNSLLLLQISSAIKERFDVTIPFRQLIEDFPTINALEIHIAQELSPEALTAISSSQGSTSSVTARVLTEQTFSANAQNIPTLNQQEEQSTGGTTVEQLLAQQLQVLSKQLELLRKGGSSKKIFSSLETTQLASRASPATGSMKIGYEKPNSQKTNSISLINSKQTEKESIARLSPRQKEHLNALIARFAKRTQESKRLTQVYRSCHANGRAVTGFLPSIKEIIYPVHAQCGKGARLWDVDGNEYVDISMGFGALLFGHSPSFAIEAIQEHIKQGIQHGPQSRLAGQVAELICELTGAERAAFCTTGTEAVMGAIRLARAATGRAKIALFANSFHGTSDEVLVREVTTDNGTLRSAPIASGIPQHMTENVMLLKYGSPESLDILKAHAHELAAVLVEPLQSGRPDFQPKMFLHELRELTESSYRLSDASRWHPDIVGYSSRHYYLWQGSWIGFTDWGISWQSDLYGRIRWWFLELWRCILSPGRNNDRVQGDLFQASSCYVCSLGCAQPSEK